jgi:hypothetical protein
MFDFIRAHAEGIQIFFAVACTLGIYSILYRENKIYRFFEHIFIGLAAGWAIKTAWIDVLKPLWWDRMVGEGRWWWFYAFPVGLLLYFIYSKKHNWMARISIGIILGINAGQQFQQFSGLYYKQINTTFKPLVPKPEIGAFKAVTISGAINNWIFLIILTCVMTYFFFSFEHGSKVIRKTANAGRWFLMVAFGAIFGSTIMARLALFIGRVDFLVLDAGGRLPIIGKFLQP